MCLLKSRTVKGKNLLSIIQYTIRYWKKRKGHCHSREQNLYILDEPTSGLNNADISKFEKVLFALQEKGNTILIVEHNIEFISHVADYIVDFGLVGGNAGGKIVSQGCPQDVFENEKSSLFGLKY